MLLEDALEETSYSIEQVDTLTISGNIAFNGALAPFQSERLILKN